MRNSSINSWLVFVVAALVFQNACVNCSCPVADIKFELYKDHIESLQSTFVGMVEKPQVEDEIVDALFNEGANDLPVGGGVLPGIRDHFANEANYEKQKEVEREKAVAIIKAIVQHILSYKKFEIKVYLDTFEYILSKSTDKDALNEVDSGLFRLIRFFSDPSSPVQEDPTFAASVILPLANFVESFMKIVKLEEKISGKTLFPPKVPCILAQTIEDYFKPTLLERLDEIDVQTDQHRFDKEGKFASMHETLKKPFDPHCYTVMPRDIRCDRKHGDKAAFDREIENQLHPFTSTVRSFGFWQSMDTDLNMGHNDVTLLKDNLGDENDFFLGTRRSHGHCAEDYFLIVRHRLEQVFGSSFKKVQQFCTLNRNVTKTGKSICLKNLFQNFGSLVIITIY